MTQSQRLDRYASYVLYDKEIVSISNDQFTTLETAGRRKFNDAQRKDIEKAFYFFIVTKDRDILASTLEEQFTTLNRFQESVNSLHNFFSLADPSAMEGAIRKGGWHGAFRVENRLEDALTFPLQYDENRKNEDEVWEQRRNFVLERPKHLSVPATQQLLDRHNSEPLVNLDEFKTALNWLRLAGERAIATLEAECRSDSRL
jgi:hypothetical protein